MFPGLEQMLERLQTSGEKYGLNYGKLEILANSKKALLVGELARDNNLNNEYTDEMFKAYFEECLNIGLDDIIIQIGEKVGLTKEDILSAMTNHEYEHRLHKNHQDGIKYQINSVPTFIIDDKYALVGAQDSQKFIDIFESIK